MENASLLTLLPEGVRSNVARSVNGLDIHYMEAGFEGPARPLILLLHGFPELAFSWRKVVLPLANAGYHVVAPDQRGYGLTRGWDPRYDGDLASFRLRNLVEDMAGLVASLGRSSAAAVVGHDFGSPVAANCALLRPEIFGSVVLMSAPYGGPPAAAAGAEPPDMGAMLAALDPPRKHYQAYYSTPDANGDMQRAPQGLHAFLRAYYHVKSADWAENRPRPLREWSAQELARLPRYYVMDLEHGMAETVAPFMPSPEAISRCAWLSEAELAFYAEQFAATGFQGGLQWYRCERPGGLNRDLAEFAGRRIEVPACFIAGRSDWGVYQKPGLFETMREVACADMRAVHLVDGAGHWVQQERPEAVVVHILDFLRRL